MAGHCHAKRFTVSDSECVSIEFGHSLAEPLAFQLGKCIPERFALGKPDVVADVRPDSGPISVTLVIGWFLCCGGATAGGIGDAGKFFRFG